MVGHGFDDQMCLLNAGVNSKATRSSDQVSTCMLAAGSGVLSGAY